MKSPDQYGAILKAFAADLGVCGPQYAPMLQTLREAGEVLSRVDSARHALEYINGMKLLVAALKDGTLADPYAIERELSRAERTLQHALGLPQGAAYAPPDSVPASAAPACELGPSGDVYQHNPAACPNCEEE